jgi:hypothetical protein
VGTRAEYALGADLHIDDLLLHVAAGTYAGRTSPESALAFSLLASALLLFDKRGRQGEKAPGSGFPSRRASSRRTAVASGSRPRRAEGVPPKASTRAPGGVPSAPTGRDHQSPETGSLANVSTRTPWELARTRSIGLPTSIPAAEGIVVLSAPSCAR